MLFKTGLKYLKIFWTIRMISINFDKKKFGPPECRSMDPQNAGHQFSSLNHTQNKTDQNHCILSKEWLIGNKKIPHYTNLIWTHHNVEGFWSKCAQYSPSSFYLQWYKITKKNRIKFASTVQISSFMSKLQVSCIFTLFWCMTGGRG